VLDNDMASPLTITPDASFTATNMNDGVYVIKATAALTPCSASDLDNNITQGAKAGFAVGIDNNNKTNYYGYASNGWVPYDGVTVVDEGQDTTFKIVLNYRDGKVEFYAGEDAATCLGVDTLAVAGTSAPIGIDAFGSGSISSITSGYEVAVAAYDGKKYGSVAEAVVAAGANKESVLPVSESGETPTGGTTAANDLPKIVCAVLNLDPADPNAQAKAVPVENDSETSYVTLQVPVTEEGVVKFQVKNGEKLEGTYDASAIKIPTGTGVYTVTPVLK